MADHLVAQLGFGADFKLPLGHNGGAGSIDQHVPAHKGSHHVNEGLFANIILEDVKGVHKVTVWHLVLFFAFPRELFKVFAVGAATQTLVGPFGHELAGARELAQVLTHIYRRQPAFTFPAFGLNIAFVGCPNAELRVGPVHGGNHD